MSARALRIGYTCHDAFPSTHTNTQQIFWTLSEVARLGHHIDLHVPALTGGADHRTTIARHYGAPDDTVPDTLVFTAAGDRDARRAMAKGRFDLAAPARFARSAHDVVWTRDPLALVRAVRTGLPAIFETYRPDFATAARFAPWRGAVLGRRRVAGVIAHSALAAAAFIDAGVPKARVLVAHNGYAPSLMEPSLERQEARALAGLPDDRPLLVYTGHVGPQKGTDMLISLAAALPDARLAIVGIEDGAHGRRWVEQLVDAAGVTNIVLLPRVDLTDVATYLYAADCLVIPPTDEPLRRYGRTVLPMKIFSYMAAGRPILAPALPDIREVLTDDVNAVLVAPGDVHGAARSVRALLENRPRADALGLSARASARDYTWEARATRITSWLANEILR